MTEFLREWIFGVAASAMLVSAVLALTPGGQVKKIVKLAGGVLMVLVLIRPFLGLDYAALFESAVSAASGYGQSTEEYTAAGTNGIKLIIEDKTGTYILQKAEEMGLAVSVEVFAEVPDTGYPYPAEVVIKTEEPPSPEQKERLASLVSEELAIPVERQMWTLESGSPEGEGG